MCYIRYNVGCSLCSMTLRKEGRMYAWCLFCWNFKSRCAIMLAVPAGYILRRNGYNGIHALISGLRQDDSRITRGRHGDEKGSGICCCMRSIDDLGSWSNRSSTRAQGYQANGSVSGMMLQMTVEDNVEFVLSCHIQQCYCMLSCTHGMLE